ncbi:glutamate-rich protein 1 [Gadus chalcogrammus]|uniref:glutamate-rich protein 1 n=1 Tax=Gadus chalcogrammus TaxID=1042646 RepID=UPI0024C46C76|nr:glutamate-rich protein 1 [Gadus chalcogrammus]
MAQRKDVFQSKVLNKLYHKAPTEQNKPNPINLVEILANKPALKRKTFPNSVKDDGESLSSSTDPGLRVYTALPPPADYRAGPQGESVTQPQPERINSDGEAAAESGDDTDQDGPSEDHRRRRRRRGKKTRAPREHSSIDGATGAAEPKARHLTRDSNATAEGGGGDGGGGGEPLSRNRRRKLKKKRHKEKLHALGLAPRASALEFTYQREGDEEEEEGEEEEGKSADEVSRFLKSTMEIYLSDGSVHPDWPTLPTAALQKLLSNVIDGSAPPSVLRQLTRLMGLVQRKEAGRLAQALEDLCAAPLAPEETAALVPLFRYWITDILPMQRDAKE